MKCAQWWVVRVSVVALAAAMLCGSAAAQEAAKPKAAGEKKAAAEKPAKGRLPANFGKLGVDPAQREKILDVRTAFAEKKATLQKQLDDIEAEEMAAMEALLTPAQKQKLASLREEAKAARDKKAADKKAADGKEPAKGAAKKAA
jgi:hypothetical protein